VNEQRELQERSADPAPHTVVFQHIPWFMRQETEETCYFNFEPRQRAEYLAELKAAGVSLVVSGHVHSNMGGVTQDGKLEQLVLSAVGRQLSEEEIEMNVGADRRASDHKSGYCVVMVTEGGIFHEYHPFE